MQKLVLSFGEALWDLLPSGPALGGAPCNFAFRVRELGDEAKIVTRLGRDEWGIKARHHLNALRMDDSLIQWDDHRSTGTVRITLDLQGNPDFFIVPDVAYDFIEPSTGLLELAAKVDCLYFGTLVQRAAVSRRTLRQLLEMADSKLKFLDLNLRKNCFFKETVVESLQHADILKLNLEEAHYLADLFEMADPELPEFCAEIIREWSLACCIVTLGEHGVFASDTAGLRVYLPGYQVRVVDTCGSGDAFSAGFVHEYLRGQSLQECCLLGNALGSVVATQPGATTPVGRTQIAQFIQTNHERIIEPALGSYRTG